MVINVNLLDEVCLYASIQEHISIHCDPDQNRSSGFFLDPYIKICDSGKWTASKNTVRVHLTDMGLDYSHKDGKGDLILNSKIIDLLNSAMDKPSNYISRIGGNNGKQLTVKEAIKDFILYSAINSGSQVAKLPDNFDFKLCYIRKGKEPIYGTRKLDI